MRSSRDFQSRASSKRRVLCLPTCYVRFKEPYTDQEAYEEQEPYTDEERYTKQVPYTEQEAYEENEPYTVTEYQNVQVAEKRTKRRGLLRKKKTYTVQVTKSVPVQVQRLRPVTRHREVTRYRAEERTRPVTRYRAVTRQRDVTRCRTATRTVDRTVEYVLPVEDFHQAALEEILAEVRASFRARASVRAPADVVRPEDSVSQVAASHAGDSGVEAADDDSWSFISSGQGRGPNCFLPDALFQVSASGEAGGHEDSYFLHARHLAPGSKVRAADGRTLQVTHVLEHQVSEVLELTSGDFTAPLRISPFHRVVTPGNGEVQAGSFPKP